MAVHADRDGTHPGPLDARAMRQGNLSLVLRAFLHRPNTSQAELVQETGLTKPATSRLVEELVRLGWVRPTGAAPGPVGRPPVLFASDPGRGLVMSTRVSVEGVSVLVSDFGGAERGRRVDLFDVRHAAAYGRRGIAASVERPGPIAPGVQGTTAPRERHALLD
jgi:MarR family